VGTTALVRITKDLRSTKAERKVTVHVLLNFSMAFDLPNHALFDRMLNSRYDCHTSAMGMVSSFLRNLSIVDEVGSLSSRDPQGCIPSLLFIDDLCFCIRFSKFHFYADADDLQIYLSGDRRDLDEMIFPFNEDLPVISRWSAENGLLLSLRKLQAILISNSAVDMMLSSLFFGMEEIPWCVAVTDLGLVIDGHLCFNRQVTKVCSRVYAILHIMRLL
jgi:hypothetical protein